MKAFIKEAFCDNKGRVSIKRILGALLCLPFAASAFVERVPLAKMEALGWLIALFITGTVIEKFSKHSDQ